jgi:hypothetical protein
MSTSPAAAAGWVPVGRQRWYDGWLALWGIIGLLVLIDVVQGVFWLARLVGAVPALAIAAGSAVVVIVAGTLLFNRRGGQVTADFSGHRLKVGTRTVDFSDLVSASLFAASPSGVILFRLESPDVRASFVLRDSHGEMLDEATRTLLAEIVRLSSVDYPTSPYDPDGRFAEYNFPDNLDKARAIELLQSPEHPGGPLSQAHYGS